MFYRHETPRAPVSALFVFTVIGGGFLLGLAALAGH